MNFLNQYTFSRGNYLMAYKITYTQQNLNEVDEASVLQKPTTGLILIQNYLNQYIFSRGK